MSDLTYFSRRTMQPLPFEAEDGCAVIEQFESDWFVRVSRVNLRPYVKIGGETLDLKWTDQVQGYTLPESPRRQDGLQKLKQEVTGSAGLLWLYTALPGGGERELTPPLYVGPGSLTEEEYSGILRSLGQIAVSLEGVALAPVLSPQIGAGGLNGRTIAGATDRLIEQATAYLRLFDAFDANWSVISKAPSRQMTLAPALVDAARPGATLSAHAVQRSAQRPDLRRLEVLEPQISENTPENRFVRFVIKTILLDKAVPLTNSLRSRSTWLRTATTRPPRAAGRRYLDLWQQGRHATEQTALQLQTLAGRIEGAGRRVEQWLQESFLADLPGSITDEGALTPRLTSSNEYGPLYRAFMDYKTTRPGEMAGSDTGVVWALQERLIYPSWRLYELWAFIQTYATLVDRFGFRPVGPTPLDRIRLVGEDAVLSEKESFELEFTPANGTEVSSRKLRARLEYGPRLRPEPCDSSKHCYRRWLCPQLHCYTAVQANGDWSRSGLTPDIVLRLETEEGSVIETLVMDAKYRRYAKQQYVNEKDRAKYGAEDTFELDLFGTAKMKYRDALPCAAAFIVHSDADPQYTLLGNDVLARVPLRERTLGDREWWPGHHIGAVYVSPERLADLEQVIKCFLMYHAGIVDVCWRCGRVLTEGNKGLTRQSGWQGDYYQCTCGNFWIVQHCRKAHTLIKLGSESFHKTVSGKEWQCVCPECGDAPSWDSDSPPRQTVVVPDYEY